MAAQRDKGCIFIGEYAALALEERERRIVPSTESTGFSTEGNRRILDKSTVDRHYPHYPQVFHKNPPQQALLWKK